MKDFQPYSDRIGVPTNAHLIIQELNSRGYIADMNCGKDFDENSKENYAKWIIGQCIANLEWTGAIHHDICKVIDIWIKKFVM